MPRSKLQRNAMVILNRCLKLGVEPKIGVGVKPPKMDGENNGKPYEQMDDLGGYIPLFLVQHPTIEENEM